MPALVFVLLFKMVFEAVRVFRHKAREAKPAPLCADCFFAQVQYARRMRGVRSPARMAGQCVR